MTGFDPDWRDRAACLGQVSRDHDPWDPPDDAWTAPAAVRRICEQCPVRLECLIDALAHDDACVRGGTTKPQRDAMKRPRNRSRCPVCESKTLVKTRGAPFEVCVSCGLTWRTPERG